MQRRHPHQTKQYANWPGEEEVPGRVTEPIARPPRPSAGPRRPTTAQVCEHRERDSAGRETYHQERRRVDELPAEGGARQQRIRRKTQERGRGEQKRAQSEDDTGMSSET